MNQKSSVLRLEVIEDMVEEAEHGESKLLSFIEVGSTLFFLQELESSSRRQLYKLLQSGEYNAANAFLKTKIPDLSARLQNFLKARLQKVVNV